MLGALGQCLVGLLGNPGLIILVHFVLQILVMGTCTFTNCTTNALFL